MQLKLNDIYRVRDILCCGRSERRLSFTSGNVRRDGQGTMEEEQKKKRYENSHRKFRATDRPRTWRNDTSEEQRPDGHSTKGRSVVDC